MLSHNNIEKLTTCNHACLSHKILNKIKLDEHQKLQKPNKRVHFVVFKSPHRKNCKRYRSLTYVLR